MCDGYVTVRRFAEHRSVQPQGSGSKGDGRAAFLRKSLGQSLGEAMYGPRRGECCSDVRDTVTKATTRQPESLVRDPGEERTMVWLGTRRVAFIPTRPTDRPAPGNWPGRISERIYYDPDEVGEDCSLQAYINHVSYGRARLEADLLPEAVVAPADCGAMQDAAIGTLPRGHSHRFA